MTGVAAAIFVVLIPVLFWAAYHYYKDRHRPEPILHLVLCLGLGVLAAFLASWSYFALGLVGLRYDALELAQDAPLSLLVYSILGIGLHEELLKFIPFWLVALRFREFDEPVDGIIYASFIALGFAAVENVRYLEYLTATDALARGFSGPLVHIMFASIWGYLVGKAWLQRRRVLPAIGVGIAAAALAHGLYDFIILGLPAWALPVAALIILAIWIWRIRLILALQKQHLDGQLPDT